MYDQRVIVKKKKSHEHKHHGGSWKVAYADFVTAMMAFFMVMWILGMSEQDRSIIAAYFNDPIGFTKNQPKQKVNLINFKGAPVTMNQGQAHKDGSDPKQDDEKKMRGIAKQVTAAIHTDKELSKLAEQIQVTMTSEGLRIELVEQQRSAFFDSGKATLRRAGERLVERIGGFLARSGRKLSIEGHTDAMPYGGPGYTNWDLSQDRASTVRRTLCASGLKETQLVGVHGYADTRLKDPEHPLSEVNRRVSILLPFSDEAQGRGVLPKDQLRGEFDKGLGKPGIKF